MDLNTGPDATPEGEFTDGNPFGSPPVNASTLIAKWANTVQRELINLVEGGGLELAADEYDQALRAVIALAQFHGTGTAQVKRPHLWAFPSVATGTFARLNAVSAAADLGLYVPVALEVVDVNWRLNYSVASPSSTLEIVAADGTPTVLETVNIAGAATGSHQPTSLTLAAASQYALRWADGGSGANLTGWVEVLVRPTTP